jgi:hypothetical protein
VFLRRFVLWMMALLVFMPSSFILAETDEAIFKNLAGKIFTMDTKDDKAIGEFYRGLRQFHKDFPSSRFADDSVLLFLIVQISGSKTEIEAKPFLAEFDKFFDTFPKGSVEKETIALWKENGWPPMVPFSFPYKYMKNFAHNLFESSVRKNHSASLQYYLPIKDVLDYSKDNLDNSGMLAFEVYTNLAFAYALKKDYDRAEAMLIEGASRSPDNEYMLKFKEDYMPIFEKERKKY